MRRALHDPKVLLGLIIALGLTLRLADAGTRLSHDEGYSWLVASAGSWGAFLHRLAIYENTPPLFYLLLAPLPVNSEVWLRVPSIVAGVAMISVLYLLVKPLLGSRAGLLAALGLAVAPFAVSYSDYARGFMVAGLGLTTMLLAAQRLAMGGSPRRWWPVFVLGGIWSVYSEFYASLYVAAIVGALLAIGRPSRRDTSLFGALPFLAFVPWIPQVIDSHDALGKTKTPFFGVTPTPRVIRDAVVPLVFGEHGAATSSAVRDLQALVVIAVIAFACAWVWRRARREAFWLLAGVLIAGVALQLLATAVETNIFKERYLTTLIPLGSALVAAVLVEIPWRYAVHAAAATMVVLGVAIFVHRAGTEYEPDSPAAVAVAEAHGYRMILTNSAVIAFYGRRLHVIVDRPMGLGQGIERSCAPRCAVIDDGRFGGVRPGPGPTIAVGPIVVRFPPHE